MANNIIKSYLTYENIKYTSPLESLQEQKIIPEPEGQFIVKWTDFNGNRHAKSFIFAKSAKELLSKILKPGKASESADVYQIFISGKPVSDRIFNYIANELASIEASNVSPDEYLIALQTILLRLGVIK